MRVIFMGTPEFAVPSLKSIAAESGDFELALVVTGADKPRRNRHSEPEPTPVKKAALELGLPVYESDDVNAPEFLETVARHKPDVIVVAAFRILPPEVFGIPPLGTFNLHASLLPAFRGAAPINWSIISGESRTGVTTFFLQKTVDTGNIILMQETGIGPEENASELTARLSLIGADVVVKTLRLIGSGSVNAARQDDSLATRAPKLTRENTRIIWDQPVRRLHDFVRGLALRPGAWTTFNEKIVKIYRAFPLDSAHVRDDRAQQQPAGPGSLDIEGDRLFVKGSDGWLEILQLQAEGKKTMAAAEFLRGLRHADEPLRFS